MFTRKLIPAILTSLLAFTLLCLGLTSGPGSTPRPRFTSTAAAPTPSPSVQPTSNALDAYPCVPASTQPDLARVVEVIDGDTIRVSLDGQEATVRYIGMDTPESTRQMEPFGPEAAAKNAELVAGQSVLLVKDVSETDRFGRLLRYVFAGELFVNYELVHQGYASAVTFPPDVACESVFQEAEQQARSSLAGFWALTPTPPPTLTPDPSYVPACPEGCTAEQPGCAIKGNISGDGEKIFHVPGQRDYENTRIDPEAGERWFCTEEEAVENGWRKSLR